MKKIPMLLAGLGLIAFAANASAVNLLSNPDIDTVAVSTQIGATPVGWQVTSFKSASGAFTDGASSEGFANVLQPTGQCSGSGCGLFFKAFQGTLLNPSATPPTVLDLVNTELYQDNSGSAGATYSLTGWAGAGAGYIGLTDPTVKSQFGLQFYNASNTLLGSTTIDLNLLGLGVVNGNPFGYKQFTVTATAPAGTAIVRSLAQQLNAYGNPAGGDQAFVVDSFDLERVPEPASIALGMLGLVGMFGAIRRRS
jgi:hypothetical protein